MARKKIDLTEDTEYRENKKEITGEIKEEIPEVSINIEKDPDIKEENIEVKEEVKEDIPIIFEDIEKILEDNKKLEVSNLDEKDINLARKYLKEKRTLNGQIVGINKENVIYIKTKGFNMNLILSSASLGNLSLRVLSAGQLMGMHINFRIKEIKDNKIYVDTEEVAREEILEMEKISIANKNRNNKLFFKAKIIFFLPYGAMCKIKNKNIFGILRNKDFTENGNIPVGDVLKCNSEIAVVLKDEEEVEDSRTYFVPVNKNIEIKRKYKDEDLVKGNIFMVRVKSVQPFGCFVNIDNGVDGICSVPSYLENEVYRGVKVCYLITSSEKVDGRLRIKGKILNVVD